MTSFQDQELPSFLTKKTTEVINESTIDFSAAHGWPQ